MLASPSASTSLVDRDDVAFDSAALAARSRRSVRAYTDQPVTDETLMELLALTGRAPSAFT